MSDDSPYTSQHISEHLHDSSSRSAAPYRTSRALATEVPLSESLVSPSPNSMSTGAEA